MVLREGDGFFAERLEPSCGLAVVIVGSDARLDTVDARRRLPDMVRFEDAAFNASRAGALVAALLQGDRELASRGFEDRLHEAHRAELIPDLEVVRSALIESGADGAVLSGAGPTLAGILLDVDDSSALDRAVEVAARAEGLLSDVEGRGRPMALPVDRRGAEVT
jgi:homoserine kinase